MSTPDTTPEAPQNLWVWTHPGQVDRIVASSAADAAKQYAEEHGIVCGKRVFVVADPQVQIQSFEVDLKVGS